MSKSLYPFLTGKSNKLHKNPVLFLAAWAVGYQMTCGDVKYGYKEIEPGNSAAIGLTFEPEEMFKFLDEISNLTMSKLQTRLYNQKAIEFKQRRLR